MPIRPDPVSGVVPEGGVITGLAEGAVVVTLPLPGVGLGETLTLGLTEAEGLLVEALGVEVGLADGVCWAN